MKTILYATFLIILVGVMGIWGVANSVPSAALASSAGSNAVNTAFNSKAANLRVSLNNLFHEHTALGVMTLTALLQGADTTRLDQLMDSNQNQIATIIEATYGKKTRDSFVTLWTQHMMEYENYTMARKNGDTEKQDTARKNLATIATKLGILFDSQSNNLSANTVSTLMLQHENGTLVIVDALSSGNVAEGANLIKSGYDQAGTFADTLAKGMMLDKPSLY